MSTSQRIIVALDIGTSKITALVGEVGGARIRVLGLGIEDATGIRRGTVVDVAAAAEAIIAAKRNAERSSGFEIGRAYVSVAGKHTGTLNNRGVTALNPSRGSISLEDVEAALESARAVPLAHNQEVLHVIPRSFTLDDQEGVRNPLGLSGYRLEVEAHIVTAASASLRNLEKAVNDAGMGVDRFVLNALASGEAVLTQSERDSGVMVVDVGDGTTDLAVFIDDTVWHTAVIEVGGQHITNDIAHILHLPTKEAERIKIADGNSLPDMVDPDRRITIEPYGDTPATQIMAHDLSEIIEARVDEMFTLVIQELKRSGYAGLLPAGIVLTGGGSELKNIATSAGQITKLPVRIAEAEGLAGLTDKLRGPAYATAIGLLKFGGKTGDDITSPKPRKRGDKRGGTDIGKALGDFFGGLLPD